MAVVFGGVVCLMLGGYLMLIQSRSNQTHRSLAWNSALAVAEAGVEESFTHMKLDGSSYAANGWTATTAAGQTVYWKRRDLPDGSYFYVTNSGVTTLTNTIQARGFVRAPLTTDYISRLVRVTLLRTSSGYNKAVSVNSTIAFNGTGSLVDSFNSNFGPYTNGVHGTNGGIATNHKQSNAISMGNGNIYGTATTGPGGGITTGPNGAIGDVSWNASHSGVQSGWSGNDMNVTFEDNKLPTGVSFTQTSINNSTTLSSGYYSLNKTTLNANKVLTISGNVVIYFSDDFTLNGNAYIRVTAGSKLTVYATGSTKFAGGGIVNDTGIAANFMYYGLPGNTSVDLSGGSSFIGVVNAPQAAVSLAGGSSVYGAIIANSFSAGGGAAVHYDEALGINGTGGGNGALSLTSYLEL